MAAIGVRGAPHMLADGAVVFLIVLAASLFGILTRPLGFLAAFWPANAILLGLFVRHPRLARAPGWIGAVAGYFAADLLTGGQILLTAWLTAANLAGVVVGTVLFRKVSTEDRQLRRPLSVLYLFGILIAVASASAMVGAGAAPAFFDRDLLSGAAFWFTTELANGIIVLPVVLTAPRLSLRVPGLAAGLRREGQPLWLGAAPAAALAGSVILGFAIGGPGAVAFPAPALLWCALSYPLFATVLLTMLVSVWHLVAVSLGLFTPETAHLDGPTVSGRLGIMLLALGPLTVASINAARNALLQRLERLATYDVLTGALTRAIFLQRGGMILAQPERWAPVSVLMLDIDRFKQINDTYGHAAGDKVLVAFSELIRQSLRERDLFGRIGGEEFAMVLPNTSLDQAGLVAERLRANVEMLSIALADCRSLGITVSIGLAHDPRVKPESLDRLLATADHALYDAKNGGRNRIVVAAS